MNSYQLKKVQRPLLNFKASKDKAKDRRKSSSEDIYGMHSKNRNAFDEEDEDDKDIVFPRSSSTR